MASYMWPTPKPNDLAAPLALPAVTGKPLTTQGGVTLDDGSGNITIPSNAEIISTGYTKIGGAPGFPLVLITDVVCDYSVQVAGASTLNSGTGAPTIAGTAGDFFFRTDTPATADQRIYVCTVSGAAGAATWVGIV